MPLAPFRIIDRLCTCCEVTSLWARETAGVEIVACPQCDRVRCTRCEAPIGALLEPPPLICEECNQPSGHGPIHRGPIL